MPGPRIFLFANGDCRDLNFYRQQINPDDLLICIDGGSRHVMAMGLFPFAVVGDSDSLDPGLRRELASSPVQWIRDPLIDQEQSDLEMALNYSLKLQPAEIIICGALGGARIDHTMINLNLLMIPFRAGIPARIIDERQTIWLMDQELTIEGRTGDLLSLFSLVPETTGITTEGLKYPLHSEPLYFASTRGLSNELITGEARITAVSGLLLVMHISK